MVQRRDHRFYFVSRKQRDGKGDRTIKREQRKRAARKELERHASLSVKKGIQTHAIRHGNFQVLLIYQQPLALRVPFVKSPVLS
jgi:hypothetical protein